MNRVAVIGLAVLAIVGGLGLGMLAAGAAHPSASGPAGSGLVAAIGSGHPSAQPLPSSPEPSDSGSTTPSSSPSATPVPTPTPSPTTVLVPAPLTGRLVTPEAAARHPIAVMIDDLSPARPQSGYSAASIVWQAPAEGGIPRYMMIFQENIPTDVGPVRSSRYYYIAWAAEVRALYAHAGGSPQALATLKAKGQGQLVYNADEFRWGSQFRRIQSRFAPHNLYTTGKQLRRISQLQGIKDTPVAWPWTFAPDLAPELRPIGGQIEVDYLANHILYRYDNRTNTYLRSNSTEKKQIDAATGKRVAPKNVVVMLMHFGPLGDDTHHHRLEATVIGTGPAWISTNGKTIQGTWKKTALTSPTQFFDKAGKPVVLTIGQTFVQVMPYGSKMTFKAGKAPPPMLRPIGLTAF